MAIACSGLATGLENTLVHRVLDLSTQLARIEITTEVKNTGNQDAAQYLLALPAAGLAHLHCEVDGQERAATVSTISDHQRPGVTLYQLQGIEGRPFLPAGGSGQVHVRMVLIDTISPLPSEIAQNDNQLVWFNDSHVWLSPYPTQQQTTQVKLGSDVIETRTKRQPSSVSGSLITYGPYRDVAAWNVDVMSVHYENNAPFIRLRKLTRQFDIWSRTVSVKELCELEHGGARLIGGFSRHDYQLNRNAYGGSSFDSIKTHLRFKKEHGLPFELLSDPSGAVCKKYEALVPLLGLPKRITYLIGPDGKIAASYQNMFGASDHISQMIKVLNLLV